jgi:hypothetical protein
MKARRVLALAGMMVLAALAAIPAGAGRTDTGQKVYKSFKCKARVSIYDPRTWACTTVTVDPWQADSGGTTTVTYSYRAKKTLKYVNVCFSSINLTQKVVCVYKHKYRRIRRTRVIKRVVQMTVPAVTESGGYKFDNYTRFYKRQKWANTKEAYWPANSYMCIITPSQPDFQCSGGK